MTVFSLWTSSPRYSVFGASEFVFIRCIRLMLDRSPRPRVGAIAHELNQTHHLFNQFTIDLKCCALFNGSHRVCAKKMDSLADPILRGLAIGLPVGLIVAVPIIVVAVIASRKRGEKYRHLLPGDGFNLRYCSTPRFQRWWKFFPWEGVGVLRYDRQELVFDASSNRGDIFTVRASFEKLLYYGRRNWFRNGLLPWLLLKTDTGDYYLCVETGPFIFGAGRRTRELLNSLKRNARRSIQRRVTLQFEFGLPSPPWMS